MTDRMSWYYHWLLTDVTRAKEVRLFDLGGVVRGWFREIRQGLRRERLTLTAKRSGGDLASGALATLAVFGTFAFIAWKTIQGTITVSGMVAYYMAFQLGLSSLQAVMSGFASLYEDNIFLTQYHEFTALERTVAEPAEPRRVPRPMREGIVFDGVSFAYPDTDRRAIDSVSFAIRPGEVAALVGPNGSGKTTLVKLLCRLYDPSGGRITLDGAPLEQFGVTDLRRAISVVFQDYAEYQFSARRNIWIGNVDLSEDDPAIERAAQAAGADEVIRGLRDGYDTVLGKWFEDGEELSVGEWQKVALARAFVRDAEILVFDEPTSALDPLAEWKAFEQIRALAEGRAIILISHRFSTVHLADHIHIVDHGRIVESGSHSELIALGGTYAEMYEVQAQAFQTP
jgi:ATP-binding cassette subfamily B protein